MKMTAKNSTIMRQLAELEKLADEKHDGYIFLMRFSSGWKGVLGYVSELSQGMPRGINESSPTEERGESRETTLEDAVRGNLGLYMYDDPLKALGVTMWDKVGPGPLRHVTLGRYTCGGISHWSAFWGTPRLDYDETYDMVAKLTGHFGSLRDLLQHMLLETGLR